MLDSNELQRMVDSATQGLDAARRDLAAAAQSQKFADVLAGLVNSVAECEGALTACLLAFSITKRGEDDEKASLEISDAVRDTLVGRLLNGADDNWSGRKNDCARAKFDGYRKQAQQILELA